MIKNAIFFNYPNFSPTNLQSTNAKFMIREQHTKNIITTMNQPPIIVLLGIVLRIESLLSEDYLRRHHFIDFSVRKNLKKTKKMCKKKCRKALIVSYRIDLFLISHFKQKQEKSQSFCDENPSQIRLLTNHIPLKTHLLFFFCVLIRIV